MAGTAANILVVDDEPNIRKMLAGVLEDEAYTVSSAGDVAEAQTAIDSSAIDLMLLDIQLPGVDGLTFLKDLKRQGHEVPVIMMSGHGTIQSAVEATRLGAYDFIEKPIQVERLLVSVANCLRLQNLSAENLRLRQSLVATDEIIGSSQALTILREEIARVAPTEARVLITGENGTGKELVAKALHAGSRRSRRPFIKVNCAAIPSDLLESELFGHEKGAFTGAVSSRRGKFELAQRGTLLLDEIGDMNAATQGKLLRVLEERELERVGGEKTISLDVRVFASTNQDLPRLLAEGTFRKDLYHRLKVVPIHVLPLREHPEDVPELVRHYLDHFCEINGRRPLRPSEGALAELGRFAWPGNVRELRNLMERLVIMCDGPEIDAAQVRLVLGRDTVVLDDDEDPTATLAEKLTVYERRLVQSTLAAAGGNVAEAARRLGLDRANLHRKLQRLGLKSRAE
jgi:DNA-binding NtrC family response regulator